MTYVANRGVHAALKAGQESMPRLDAQNTGVSPASGDLTLTFFTGRRAETATKFRIYTGSTAAGATPTLCRVGLFTVDDTGNLTLVASCASDTSLFAATFTAYSPTLSSSYGLVVGQRYAVGPLVVTAATMPKFLGAFIATSSEGQQLPAQCAKFAGQTDLPASITVGSLAASAGGIYVVTSP